MQVQVTLVPQFPDGQLQVAVGLGQQSVQAQPVKISKVSPPAPACPRCSLERTLTVSRCRASFFFFRFISASNHGSWWVVARRAPSAVGSAIDATFAFDLQLTWLRYRVAARVYAKALMRSTPNLDSLKAQGSAL